MNTENYNRALEKAMALCSRSEKCRKDIREKLATWRLTGGEENEAIIDKLIKDRFIDERRYAKSYARDKVRFNKWGKIKIRVMLKAKGLAEEDIEAGLNIIDMNNYLEMINDEIMTRRKTIKGKNIFDLKGKLIRFAKSRGYENEYVYNIINGILS